MIEDPVVIAKILDHLGLSSEIPRARPPPEQFMNDLATAEPVPPLRRMFDFDDRL